MASSSASTVAAYLAELPESRRSVIAVLRQRIRASLPKGYAENMSWGVIAYEIPLKRYPATHNGKPLFYMGLAAQKNKYTLYSTSAYMDPAMTKRVLEAFKATGRRLDMGKSCIHFRSLEDLPLDVVDELAAHLSVDEYIAWYESVRPKKK
jgi:uncharacterized protein YdhG (YjbR/CyaY superfamily)